MKPLLKPICIASKTMNWTKLNGIVSLVPHNHSKINQLKNTMFVYCWCAFDVKVYN